MHGKKHSFILLEVLIAILLLSLFTGTFFTSPYALMQQEMKQLHRLEMCRIADDTLLEIKQSLYKVAWHSIGEEEKAPLYILDPIHYSDAQCNRSYSIYTRSPIRTDAKSGRPYKKCLIKLELELKGEKLKTIHHVVVYAKTTNAL